VPKAHLSNLINNNMKKDELIEAIKNAGVNVNTRSTKEELETIYNGLRVHKEKEPNEVKPDEVTPDETKPDETKPDEAKPDEVKPDEVKPDEVKPDEVKPDEVKPDETKPGEVKDDFDELLGKIKGAEGSAPKPKTEKPLITKEKKKRKKGESSPDSFRIEGYILLLITDTVFPFAFAFINNTLDKKNKVEATDLQLAEKDFNKLEPLADQAADYMSINLNPIAGFAIMATFMYANNLLVVRMNLKKGNE